MWRSLAQQEQEIRPGQPDGVVPPPRDWQYENTTQPKKPLIIENRNEEDDLMNYYNPDKKPNSWYSRQHHWQNSGTMWKSLAQRDQPWTDNTKGEIYPQPLYIEEAHDNHGFKIRNEPSSSKAGRT